MNLPDIIRRNRKKQYDEADRNAIWLQQHMNPYFFQAMTDEEGALALLAREMKQLRENRHIILADRDKRLVIACLNRPGSLYEMLRNVGEREISYAMFSHSEALIPELGHELEILRFEFDRRSNSDIDPDIEIDIPSSLLRRVSVELRRSFPEFDLKRLPRLLKILWLNNENYLRMSHPARVAYLVWLLDRGNASGGLFIDIRGAGGGANEMRVLIAVGNPPQDGFMQQLLEVFNRLDVGIRRAYCQTISNGVHPYFLGSFIVISRKGEDITPSSTLARRLKRELCTTQLLSTRSLAYRDYVVHALLSGEEAALINAFVAFCHTSLAHSQPDRFGLEDVQSAFYEHPEMANLLVSLFLTRFDPEIPERGEKYDRLLAAAGSAVDGYNTGHRWLDEIRRSVYRCCLLLVTHTLKTNFFVDEKQALAFRLDPSYLKLLGREFTADLPESTPFRVTFFYSRFGAGYHIGFSDIARGGWRTVVARSADDYITSANTIFREVFVLANTQQLKNKDIYEGGSKLVLLMDASDMKCAGGDDERYRLYKLQYSVANAFLDIFITENGVARDRRVVDYYGDDEPIELGPDENMHDGMIEAIAALSRKRGYMLGVGIMSSKRFGINHKEYGVTSTGVVAFAEITMAEAAGIDMRKDPFSLKMTGGPNGDVAGNSLRILLDRCPNMQVRLVLDGTAAVHDPGGMSHEELRRIVLASDLDAFRPECLGEGGCVVYRSGRRREGLRETYRKVCRKDGQLEEEWLDVDDFNRIFNTLVFTVKTDLFIPAGGRPETIDALNWQDFCDNEGVPSARVVVEGANSFITPEARIKLQSAGVVLMRDASANKCGVISSSYEIIANLLLTEAEFMAQKGEYAADVLKILEKRAADEARLILQRYREADGVTPYSEVSELISQNINSLYSRLFEFFAARPEICLDSPFRKAILSHLPQLLQKTPRYRQRINRLPQKYLCAILAAEIGSSLVYSGNRDADFEEMIRRHLARVL